MAEFRILAPRLSAGAHCSSSAITAVGKATDELAMRLTSSLPSRNHFFLEQHQGLGEDAKGVLL